MILENIYLIIRETGDFINGQIEYVFNAMLKTVMF